MSSALFPNYKRWELEIVEGKGTKVIDANGTEYLDFVSGIAVCNLGHCHPAVVEAVQAQLQKLWHVSNLFLKTPYRRKLRLFSLQIATDSAYFFL
ncbi:hypothetical protein GCM10020331_041910 [Ectobacillus funiculus]